MSLQPPLYAGGAQSLASTSGNPQQASPHAITPSGTGRLDASQVTVPSTPARGPTDLSMDIDTMSGNMGDPGYTSPAKEVLKSEVRTLMDQLHSQNHQLRAQAQEALSYQTAGFQRTTAEYELLAKDVAQREVAQAIVSEDRRYRHTLTETANELRNRSSQISQLQSDLQAREVHNRSEIDNLTQHHRDQAEALVHERTHRVMNEAQEAYNHEYQMYVQAQLTVERVSQQADMMRQEMLDMRDNSGNRVSHLYQEFQAETQALTMNVQDLTCQVETLQVLNVRWRDRHEKVFDERDKLKEVCMQESQQADNMRTVFQEESHKAFEYMERHSEMMQSRQEVGKEYSQLKMIESLQIKENQELNSKLQHLEQQQVLGDPSTSEMQSEMIRHSHLAEKQSQELNEMLKSEVEELQEQLAESQAAIQNSTEQFRFEQNKQNMRKKELKETISELEAEIERLQSLVTSHLTQEKVTDAKNTSFSSVPAPPPAPFREDPLNGLPSATPRAAATTGDKEKEKGLENSPPPSPNPAASPAAQAGGDTEPGGAQAPRPTNQGTGASEYKPPQLRGHADFPNWKQLHKRQVAQGSGRPQLAFEWISKVEEVDSFEKLADDEGYENWSAIMASGLIQMLSGEFKRHVENIMYEVETKTKRMLNGRQITWLIYDKHKISRYEGAVSEWEEVLSMQMQGDNLLKFRNDWRAMYMRLNKPPEEAMMELLLSRQLEKSQTFNAQYLLYQQDILNSSAERNYDRLWAMLNTFLDDRARRRNRDQRNQNGTRALAGFKGSGKGGNSNGGNSNQGECYKWTKKGQCADGESCPFEHDPDKRGQRRGRPRDRTHKDKKTKRPERSPSARSSDGSQSRGRSQSKGGEVNRPKRGKSPSGKDNQPVCQDFLKGRCKNKRTCDYWHPPPCIHFKKGDCRAGRKCPYQHPQEMRKATPVNSGGSRSSSRSRSASRSSNGSKGSKGSQKSRSSGSQRGKKPPPQEKKDKKSKKNKKMKKKKVSARVAIAMPLNQ